MENTLTDCLVRVKEDLNQLQKVRDFLHQEAESEERCCFTWRTIEAFNSILSVCSSQGAQETGALDTLLDSFYYLAKNTTDNGVWHNFGFELGIICVKVLSAIERTDIFELLFSKLLSVITIMCERNSGIWKTAARQILNILINKRFSLQYLETTLKSYIGIIKNVESSVLYGFSTQNLGLLKTISLLVQKVGDFEIQFHIVEMIFLHLSNNTKLMSDFFTTTENKFFQTLHFTDFEGDCRSFLNELNKARREPERKVYSVRCKVLYVGGFFMKPPVGRNYIWVDANNDTQRITIKCGDIALNENKIIYIQFSELVNVYLDKAEGNKCLMIQTKNLVATQKDSRNDICLMADNQDEIFDFLGFLERVTSEIKRKKHGVKASKTTDYLLIDIKNSKKEVQDNAITSSNRPETDQITPDRSASNARKTVFACPELTPNSFAESFSKHLGLGSPEPKHSFEDSVKTMEFPQKDTPAKSHKLFRSPQKIFNAFEINESENLDCTFENDKENYPPVLKEKIKTYRGKSQADVQKDRYRSTHIDSRSVQGLGSQTKADPKILNIQSQDFFQVNSTVISKKKPCLPKLKRTKRTKNYETGEEEYSKSNPVSVERRKGKNFHQNKDSTGQRENLLKTRSNSVTLEAKESSKSQKVESEEKLCRQEKKASGSEEKVKSFCKTEEKWIGVEKVATKTKKKALPRREKGDQEPKPESQEEQLATTKYHSKMKSDISRLQSKTEEAKADVKPSLLDPNGYAYKRWCRPTTSERSNFWLRKLSAVQKTRNENDMNIFEFSDEVDFIFGKSIKKRKTLHSNHVESKHRSLKRIQKFLTKTPTEKETAKSIGLSKAYQRASHWAKVPCHSDFAGRRSSLGNNETDANEKLAGEGEELLLENKKRQHSDGESSTASSYLKKKTKTTSGNVRHRLQRAEQRDRHQTEQIIETVKKTVDLFIDRLQAKDDERTGSYLKTAEAASVAADSKSDELKLSGKRIQRAILYYKAGCSVSHVCKALDEDFARVRSSFRALSRQNISSASMDRIALQLNSLVKSEMERSVDNEWMWQRALWLKCACFEN